MYSSNFSSFSLFLILFQSARVHVQALIFACLTSIASLLSRFFIQTARAPRRILPAVARSACAGSHTGSRRFFRNKSFKHTRRIRRACGSEHIKTQRVVCRSMLETQLAARELFEGQRCFIFHRGAI